MGTLTKLGGMLYLASDQISQNRNKAQTDLLRLKSGAVSNQTDVSLPLVWYTEDYLAVCFTGCLQLVPFSQFGQTEYLALRRYARKCSILGQLCQFLQDLTLALQPVPEDRLAEHQLPTEAQRAEERRVTVDRYRASRLDDRPDVTKRTHMWNELVDVGRGVVTQKGVRWLDTERLELGSKRLTVRYDIRRAKLLDPLYGLGT